MWMGLAITNLIAFCAMIGVNYLSLSGRIAGYTTAEVSNQYDTFITPANWTFYIWGFIYLLLLIFVISTFFSPTARLISFRIGSLFTVSCILNMLWIVTWHTNQIVFSMLFMLGLLITLSVIASRRIARFPTIYSAGFTIYLAWISFAAIANLTILMVYLGLDGFGDIVHTWTIVALLGASVFISYKTIYMPSLLYGLTGLFAYCGIMYRQLYQLDSKYPGVITTTLIGIILIATSMIYMVINTRVIIKTT